MQNTHLNRDTFYIQINYSVSKEDRKRQERVKTNNMGDEANSQCLMKTKSSGLFLELNLTPFLAYCLSLGLRAVRLQVKF